MFSSFNSFHPGGSPSIDRGFAAMAARGAEGSAAQAASARNQESIKMCKLRMLKTQARLDGLEVSLKLCVDSSTKETFKEKPDMTNLDLVLNAQKNHLKDNDLKDIFLNQKPVLMLMINGYPNIYILQILLDEMRKKAFPKPNQVKESESLAFHREIQSYKQYIEPDPEVFRIIDDVSQELGYLVAPTVIRDNLQLRMHRASLRAYLAKEREEVYKQEVLAQEAHKIAVQRRRDNELKVSEAQRKYDVSSAWGKYRDEVFKIQTQTQRVGFELKVGGTGPAHINMFNEITRSGITQRVGYIFSSGAVEAARVVAVNQAVAERKTQISNATPVDLTTANTIVLGGDRPAPYLSGVSGQAALVTGHSTHYPWLDVLAIKKYGSTGFLEVSKGLGRGIRNFSFDTVGAIKETFISAYSNPINFVAETIQFAVDLTRLAWDGFNQISKVTVGYYSEESDKRSAERGRKTIEVYSRFKGYDAVDKTEVLTELVLHTATFFILDLKPSLKNGARKGYVSGEEMAMTPGFNQAKKVGGLIAPVAEHLAEIKEQPHVKIAQKAISEAKRIETANESRGCDRPTVRLFKGL